MIFQIKCVVCNEQMGTLEKTVITDQDIQEIKGMFTCSQGHAQVEEPVEE